MAVETNTVVVSTQHAVSLRSILVFLLIMAIALSLSIGASNVSLWTLGTKLLSGEQLRLAEYTIFWNIRVPRTMLGMSVGMALAVSGAIMQGLFRNPLADPGLLGVSSGASLGAVCVIVLGSTLPVGVQALAGTALLPLTAFFGAWLVMLTLYRVATHAGRTSIATMLLGGIGIAALSAALTGILVYIADDGQLRELIFWSLGALTGATWTKVSIATPIIVISVLMSLTLGKGLNGLSMGEATAHHIGFDTQRLKRWCIFLVATATGTAVAVSGGIGFVGIIVPHLLRLITGPDHRALLLNSALLGATLLLLTDTISRVVVMPAELPIGIVTAVIGAPVFLCILLRRRDFVDL